MWMGGNVPLGYDVKDRKLIVNETGASTVQLIFRRYAELGSVALLKAELDRLGIVSKRREGAGGRLAGGAVRGRGESGPALTSRAVRHDASTASATGRSSSSAAMWARAPASRRSAVPRCSAAAAQSSYRERAIGTADPPGPLVRNSAIRSAASAKRRPWIRARVDSISAIGAPRLSSSAAIPHRP
jgi:hypothetical protein